jgi:hypothetical protein
LKELHVINLGHDFRGPMGQDTGKTIDEKLGKILAKNQSIKRLKINNSHDNISNILEINF